LILSKATVLRSEFTLSVEHIAKHVNGGCLISCSTEKSIAVDLQVENGNNKNQQSTAKYQGQSRELVLHSSNSIYNAPSIGLAR
jgi:hypothetical protein